jgi:hypothetical protein
MAPPKAGKLVTALFREIYFAVFKWDGINSVIKGGNELPHFLLRQGYGGQAKCEFRNSQKMVLEN